WMPMNLLLQAGIQADQNRHGRRPAATGHPDSYRCSRLMKPEQIQSNLPLWRGVVADQCPRDRQPMPVPLLKKSRCYCQYHLDGLPSFRQYCFDLAMAIDCLGMHLLHSSVLGSLTVQTPFPAAHLENDRGMLDEDLPPSASSEFSGARRGRPQPRS